MGLWKPLLGSGRYPYGALLRWKVGEEIWEGMGIAAHAILTDENGKRTGDVQYSIACVDRMGYAAGAILTYLDEPPEVWEERARNFDWKEFQELARHYPIC